MSKHAAYFLMLCLATCLQTSSAQEASAPKKNVEVKTITHTVTDENGQPIVGAHVVTVGLRSVGSGAWIPWPEDDLKIAELVTDEDGQVKVPYPVEFTGFDKRPLVAEKIILQTTHTLYISDFAEFEVTAEAGRQTLFEGCRTNFTCVDNNGAAVDKFGVLIGGAGARAIWSSQNGELSSGGVPNGTFPTMLVGFGPDGLPQFSGVLPTRYAKGKDVAIRGVKLRPGLRVEGRLSENVPRPVEAGEVIAWWSVAKAGAEEYSTIGWMEKVNIDAEGKFVFPALPRSGSVQFIALCRGFMVSPNGRNSPDGITVEVGDAVPNDTLQVEVPMAEAGTVEVLVLGPDGKPLSGAGVSTWPNTHYNLHSNRLLGHCEPSIEKINFQIGKGARPAFNRTYKDYSSRYVTKTDATGKATLREVPLGQGSVFIAFPNMIPANAVRKPEVLDKGMEFTSKTSKAIEMTVKMVAAP